MASENSQSECGHKIAKRQACAFLVICVATNIFGRADKTFGVSIRFAFNGASVVIGLGSALVVFFDCVHAGHAAPQGAVQSVIGKASRRVWLARPPFRAWVAKPRPRVWPAKPRPQSVAGKAPFRV